MRFFTDGSCSPNPGPGGWSVVAVDNADQHVWTKTGWERTSTNNRMELTAIAVALEAATRGDTIITDSNLCRNTLCVWAKRWKELGWVKPDGKPPSNLDLVKRAHAAFSEGVGLEWVKAHAGNKWNELADEEAKRAAMNAASSQIRSPSVRFADEYAQ